MTIGIPTVARPGVSYLEATLHSLIENTTPEERAEVTVIILLSESNQTARQTLIKQLQVGFAEYLDRGFLLVIEADLESYPSFEDLGHTYGDSTDRVKWRSKQVIDFSVLWHFSSEMSVYYLQLEDDVICAPHFVDGIRMFIQSETRTEWAMVNFSSLGFIGKLFPCKILNQFVQFVRLFYSAHPVDYLAKFYSKLMLQKNDIVRSPALFQHVGKKSSLVGKLQPLQDNSFRLDPKATIGDNPPARIFTDLAGSRGTEIHYAYCKAPGYFHSSNVKLGNYVLLVFRKQQKLKHVVIESGERTGRLKSLRKATVEVSSQLSSGGLSCVNYQRIGFIADRHMAVSIPEDRQVEVWCLRVVINENVTSGVIIRQISVWKADQEVS